MGDSGTSKPFDRQFQSRTDKVDTAVAALVLTNTSLVRDTKDAAIAEATRCRGEIEELRRQLAVSEAKAQRFETDLFELQRPSSQSIEPHASPPKAGTEKEAVDPSRRPKEVHTSAKYLLQLVKLCDKRLTDEPLLRVLTKPRFQMAKESLPPTPPACWRGTWERCR